MTRLLGSLPASLLGATLVGLTCGGCMQREERLVIHPDGSLDVTHTFSGPPAEFEPIGDALPTGDPWEVEVRRRGPEGQVVLVRTARARFPQAADLPESFGDEAALHMRTTVTIDELPDGSLRTTFERRYEPRAWAWHARLERQLPRTLHEAVAQQRSSDRLGDAALNGLLEVDLQRRQVLLEQALLGLAEQHEWSPPARTRLLLAAHGALASRFRSTWSAEDVRAWLGADEAGRVELEGRFRRQNADLVVEAGAWALLRELAEAEDRQRLSAALREQYLEAERRMLVSEDLQDDTFTVRVAFPGQVSDPGQGVLQEDGRSVVFHFTGRDLNDAPLVLRAEAIEAAPGPGQG